MKDKSLSKSIKFVNESLQKSSKQITHKVLADRIGLKEQEIEKLKTK